jgi:hypothetical protein
MTKKQIAPKAKGIMSDKDARQMFLIMALAKALDDQLLRIESNDLRQMNKVIFKQLKLNSKKLYNSLDKTIGLNAETVEEMTDVIHETISIIEKQIEITE